MLTGLKSTLSFCLLNQGLLEDWMVLLPQLEFLSFRGLTFELMSNPQRVSICLDYSHLPLTCENDPHSQRSWDLDLISFRWRRKFLDLFGVFVHYWPQPCHSKRLRPPRSSRLRHATATAEAQLLYEDFMAFSTLELWKLQLQLLQKIEDGIN